MEIGRQDQIRNNAILRSPVPSTVTARKAMKSVSQYKHRPSVVFAPRSSMPETATLETCASLENCAIRMDQEDRSPATSPQGATRIRFPSGCCPRALPCKEHVARYPSREGGSMKHGQEFRRAKPWSESMLHCRFNPFHAPMSGAPRMWCRSTIA